MEVIRLAEAWDVTLKTHIFITEKEQNYDLRTLMRFLLESKLKCPTGRSLFTGLRAETHFGRPKFNELLELIMQENPSTGKIGVFRIDFIDSRSFFGSPEKNLNWNRQSCGPPGLTKNVDAAAKELNQRDHALFDHFFENFWQKRSFAAHVNKIDKFSNYAFVDSS